MATIRKKSGKTTFTPSSTPASSTTPCTSHISRLQELSRIHEEYAARAAVMSAIHLDLDNVRKPITAHTGEPISPRAYTHELDALDERLEAMITELEGEVPTPEELENTITIDRSIRPSYPNWVKTVMHPDLEASGPTSYDIRSVEQFLLPAQETAAVTGTAIYEHLKATDTLRTCLGLRDLEEIQKKGIEFFRKHIEGKAVLGWAGVVRHQDGNLYVPYLYELDGRVVLHWGWVDRGWSSSDPALRHASSPQI